MLTGKKNKKMSKIKIMKNKIKIQKLKKLFIDVLIGAFVGAIIGLGAYFAL